jgi:lysozyme
MNIGTALGYAVAIINGAEGFTATAFLDRLAKPPVWTIGHGTTRIDGKPVIKGMTCTRPQADLWAMTDMTADAHFVLGKVHVPLNDWQLAALISFCYNIGAGDFERSSVLEALNLKLYLVAANRLLEYDEAGGEVVPGLETRRGRERAMFLIGLGMYTADFPGPEKPDRERIAAAPRPPTPSETDALNQAELDKLDGKAPPTST